MKNKVFSLITVLLLTISNLNAQQLVIDKFENLREWNAISSDAAKISVALEKGFDRNSLKIDFEFLGAGYCGIEKIFPFELPENYKFTFWLKGISPKNNLEFKLVDKSGDNVWWKNQRNFEFPEEWEKITIRKRDIEFAWGPIGGGKVTNFDRLQIFIAAAEGGKGTIYLDDLSIEEIPLPEDPNLKPIISSPSGHSDNKLNQLLDGNFQTLWKIPSNTKQSFILDFQFVKEIGGLVIHWDKTNFAADFNVSASNNKKSWENVFTYTANKLDRNFIYLNNVDARYLKFDLNKSASEKGYGIKEIEIKDPSFSQDLNNFFTDVAHYYHEGSFPKYFYDKQSFWTVVGVSEDLKEGLINEQGTIEVDKTSFSVEPFLQLDNKLITWNNVDTRQALENKYLPIPSVTWIYPSFNLEIKTLAFGEPGNSALLIRYRITNSTDDALSGKFLLAIRPYQVNPKWQFLNNQGGVSQIKNISLDGKVVNVNNNKKVISLSEPSDFGAAKFNEGEIIDFLQNFSLPKNKSVTDDFGFASAGLSYNFNLLKNEYEDFIFIIPFYEEKQNNYNYAFADPNQFFDEILKSEADVWKQKLDKIEIHLPGNGEKILNTLKSNLAYILINKDGPAIQPGSRSYERSWIRDGALTSSALLRLGLKDEVRNYLDWYSQFQFPSGKIPCVVDNRGADPTPENDSHGEYIYAILQYFKFTNDTLFLKNKLHHVIGAVNYIEYLTNQRKTNQYKKEDSLVFYGLMPESISHEGYSAKPMHSYWDDFFTLRGLRDAVIIAAILGENELEKQWSITRDSFETDLYNSIKLAIKNHKIDYIPGCAELGDFDATSTTISLFPGNEQQNLPQKELLNTFNKYYDHFKARLEPDFDWINYTPYELRTVGSFVLLDQREISHEQLDFFFKDQHPYEWNHWAEVVWKNKEEPKFIGDMPHTWIGSDYINSIRMMLVYENYYDSSLVLGAGLTSDWIDSPEGISINNLPTYFGSVSYTIKKVANEYQINISGNVQLSKNKILFKNFKNILPKKVIVNGINSSNFNIDEIRLNELPASVVITF